MIKKSGKYNWKLVVVICIALTVVNSKYSIIILPKEMLDYQFNILSISSVLAGFSFTSLGLLLGMSSEKIVKKLEGSSVMYNCCNRLKNSILALCISIANSLCFVLCLNNNIVTKINNLTTFFDINNIINNFVYIQSMVFLLVGFVLFVLSLYTMAKIIESVYDFDMNGSEKRKKLFMDSLKCRKDALKKGDEQI